MSTEQMQTSRTNNRTSEQQRSLRAERLEKRKLKKDYRDLINTVEDIQPEAHKDGLALLNETILKANSLIEKVSSTHEASLDSKLVVRSTKLGKTYAENLKLDDVAFDRELFVNKLINYGERQSTSDELDGNDNYYNVTSDNKLFRLGALAARFISRAPALQVLPNNLFDKLPPPKKHAERKRHRAEPGAHVKPKELKQNDLDNKRDVTTMRIEELLKNLKSVQPINLYEFVINPKSYAQTVENIFYLSFLIRDNRAELNLENGQPMLKLAVPINRAKRLENGAKSSEAKRQLIIDLDYYNYNRLVNLMGLKESIIPDRTNDLILNESVSQTQSNGVHMNSDE